MLTRSLLCCLLLGSLLLGQAAPAPAAPEAIGSRVSTPHVEASLVAEGPAVAGARLTVALRLAMIPGWHSYWRNPGDSGLPTTIAWTLPDGVAAGPLQWPYPEAIPVPPLMNYGYEGTVLLLTDIAVPAGFSAAALPLRARADWLVCAEICIPEGADLALEVAVAAPGTPPAADPGAALAFEQTRAALPLPAPFPVVASRVGNSLALTLDSDQPFETARFFPYDGAIIAADPQPFTGRGLTVSLDPAFTDGRLAGIVVASRRGWTRAYEIAVAVPPAPAAAVAAPVAAAAAEPLGLALALLFALAGGLILNLMPCVLPVLAIKALALAGHQRDPGGRRRLAFDGFAYTLGVLACFGGLAVLLLALRGAGEAIGWGFQLQSPLVVGLLALLFAGLGLLFLGAVELGGGLSGMGEGLVRRGGLPGSFATGLLAAVVATPCTAPFMGAALGFALTQPAVTAVAVFLALGFGMALPFLAVALVPALARLLPRPGAWMVRFRQVLAFPMFASAAWLVWVLAIQAGSMGLAAILGALVLLGFAAWALGLNGPLGRLLALAALLGALVLAAQPAPQATAPGPGRDGSEAYSPERLAALRAQGRPVFVNLTAAWCITCLVNERVALEGAALARLMSERGITYLKGDWTNRDPAITALLAAHGRSGVPLYLAFPGGGAAPLVLPQILTESAVIEALSGL